MEHFQNRADLLGVQQLSTLIFRFRFHRIDFLFNSFCRCVSAQAIDSKPVDKVGANQERRTAGNLLCAL